LFFAAVTASHALASSNQLASLDCLPSSLTTGGSSLGRQDEQVRRGKMTPRKESERRATL
jgi:hypothetical protein